MIFNTSIVSNDWFSNFVQQLVIPVQYIWYSVSLFCQQKIPYSMWSCPRLLKSIGANFDRRSPHIINCCINLLVTKLSFVIALLEMYLTRLVTRHISWLGICSYNLQGLKPHQCCIVKFPFDQGLNTFGTVTTEYNPIPWVSDWCFFPLIDSCKLLYCHHLPISYQFHTYRL